jgi:hypothetical protein
VPELALPCRIPELVEMARAEVPLELGPGSWERLARIVDPLPPVASEAAVEVRLGAGGGPVDFELCIRPDAGARARAARSLDSQAFQRAAKRSVGWRRAGEVLRRWADPGSVLHFGIAVLWLEFDVPELGEAEPFSVLTLSTELAYPDGVVDRARLDPVLFEGLSLLADGLAPDTARSVSAFLDALPRTAELRHAALRPASTGEVVRLVLRAPWRSLPQTLERAGWPGPLDELQALLTRLDAPGYALPFNLDITTEGPGGRLGIEFCYSSLPGTCPRWRRLFAQLEAAGACSAQAARRLEMWGPGGETRNESLRVRRELLVKVVYEPGAPLTAKAYLAFGPRLVLDAATRAGAFPSEPRGVA